MTATDWEVSTDPEAMLQFLQHGTRRVDDEQVGDPPPRPSDRKLRLLACACCRAIWEQLTDNYACERCLGSGIVIANDVCAGKEYSYNARCPTCSGTGRINRSRRAVETAERYADGKATDEELAAARTAAWNAVGREAWDSAFDGAWSAVGAAVQLPMRAAAWSATEGTQCHILRDLFAPFRPVSLPKVYRAHPTMPTVEPVGCLWITPTVLELARAAYASGNPMDPAALAVLADALEGEGCTDPHILRHLRGEGQYIAGVLRVDRPSNEIPAIDWRPLPTPHYRGCHVLDAILNLE